MRVHAYVMAADPAWLEASVLSYYDLVEKIIVNYDENGLSWTGTEIEVDQCLKRLKAIDRDKKMVFLPGHYARTDHQPMENDTFQRQAALREAEKEADWIIQIDTDEVLADAAIFMDCLKEADEKGFRGMEFPARRFFNAVGNYWYLEDCRRFWRIAAGFPGPVAVKPGATLRAARQSDATLFRVDFSLKNTDPWRAKDAVVHRAIKPNQGIYHYSRVRDPVLMHMKSLSSSHANDYNWQRLIRRWEWAARHPILSTILPRKLFGERLRLARIRHEYVMSPPLPANEVADPQMAVR